MRVTLDPFEHCIESNLNTPREAANGEKDDQINIFSHKTKEAQTDYEIRVQSISQTTNKQITNFEHTVVESASIQSSNSDEIDSSNCEIMPVKVRDKILFQQNTVMF